jgi:integrase
MLSKLIFETILDNIMASIKLSIQSESENASIFLRLSIGRGFYIKRKTGISINSKDWSKSTGFPKQNNPKNKNLTSQLRKLISYVLDSLNNDLTKGVEVDGDWLNNAIDVFFNRAVKTGSQSELLVDNIQRIIDTARTRKNGKGSVGLSVSRIKSYGSLITTVEAFQKHIKKKVKVKDVDLKFVNQFADYMNSQSYSVSYIQKKISDVKTVCSDAQLNGVETHPQLISISGKKVKNEHVLYLTEEELELIENTEFNRPALENTKKWALLGSMIGQRGNDLLNLTEENRTYRSGLDLIELTQQKGNKKVSIPISPDMEELLKDGFPYKISIQKFNEYMKDVCRIAGVDTIVEGYKYDSGIKRRVFGKYPKWEIISSHDLRRTFATNKYGVWKTPLIMSITGHSTERTFLNYIGKTEIDYAHQIAELYHLESKKSKKEFEPKIIKNKNVS